MVELKAMVFIVSGKQKGDSKGTETSSLGIKLFEIANILDELFYRDGFLILILVATSSKTGLVNENIGVGRQTSDITSRVRT